MISTIHLEYTADMTHMKVTGIDNETVFKHTFYDPVNKVKTNIVFDGTVALCEKVSDYESDMTKCENTSTTCVKKFTQESVLTHSDISTFIAWVREYAIQSEFLYDQGLVSGLRFTYKYVESGESFTQRFVTDAERLAWNAKWDYDEAAIKSVKVDNATNADTVGGKTVAADVPAGAKFTDTVYTHPASHPASMITQDADNRFVSDVEKLAWNSKSDTDTVTTINGKTGAITKADIVALGIPAQDTVYTHPTTHSISEVDGLQTALDGKVDDSQVLTNVPLNAKFTDTITTINGKTGAISKADIVALGIPAQDTVYSHPNSHPASMITESSTKRFVSDTKISEWDSKETTTGSQDKANQAEQNAKDYTDQEISSIDIPDSTWESIQNKPDTFAPSEHVHSIGSVTDLQNELNSKETPSGAQSKANVAESNAKDYVDGKVLTDVPLNAKFTDTVYSHPSSHPASMITESTTKRFVSDAEKTLWNSKSEFSGNYNDLSNKPTIPSNTSQLTNNSGYITINDIPDVPPSIQVGGVKPTDGSMWYEVI